MHDIPEEEVVMSRTKRALKSVPAQWSLGGLSFLESFVLPIVIDPILVMMTLADPARWKRFSFIASATSVLGGAAGYILGALFFGLIGEKLIALYNLEHAFERTAELFNGNAFWVTLFGAVTPIPYKMFAITGGFLYVDFIPFILASILGRFGRFYLVGFVTYQFGKHAANIFARRFNQLMLALASVAILYVVYVFVR